MVVLLKEFALVVEPQTVVPPDPVTLHVRFPVGDAARGEPVTVAVIVSLPPRVGATGVARRDTEGATLATTVVLEDVVEVIGLYEVSPENINVAPYVPTKEAMALHV